MAEVALRSCGDAGTPRKRSRDPNGSSCWEFRTPERKRLRALPESPAQNSRQENREEEEEEEAFPGKSARSLRLDIPAGNPGIPGNSQPSSASSHNSQLPVGAFYGKRIYLDPLQRKRLRELLGDGSGPEKPGNSGNPSRNSGRNSGNPGRNSSGNRSSKSKPNPKARREIPKGKSSGNAGNSRSSEAGSSQNSRISQNSQISRHSERFRVLSAGVRPPLRLPLGSAFFLSRKRSRKNPGNSSGKSLGDSGAASRDPSEKAGKAEKAGEESAGRIPEAREEEKENRECSGEAGTAGNGGRNSEGKEEAPGIPPSPSPDSRDSPGPRKEPGSPCPAGLFPIFLPARKRPLQELPAPLSPSGKAPRRSKESSRHSRDQMIIDAGQRSLSPERCGSCGMLFSPALPEDRLQHLRHHRSLRQRPRFPGWKQERVVAEFWDGKIVLILPGDPKHVLRKARLALAAADPELGLGGGAPSSPRRRLLLFLGGGRGPAGLPGGHAHHTGQSLTPLVNSLTHPPAALPGGGGALQGCLEATPITQAFRVLPEPFPDSRDTGGDSDSGSPRWAWRCRRDPEPAVCGISRIWVLPARRRRGIARRMLDTLRRTFVFGAVLDSQDLAFSDPTPDGRSLAAAYCNRPDFLVCSFLPGSPGSPGSGSAGSPGSP
ncbi:N-acetyltransferase ESCO2, partial [Cyanistes caeruleus]|uniref:N-acetyltransferase ESCO2 n=1 Tax=Cyanistes caeruleus TaxID=156563 RepID=UPI000CDB9841